MSLKELQLRINFKDWKLEWNDIERGLEASIEIEITDSEENCRLRMKLQDVCSKVFQAAGGWR